MQNLIIDSGNQDDSYLLNIFVSSAVNVLDSFGPAVFKGAKGYRLSFHFEGSQKKLSAYPGSYNASLHMVYHLSKQLLFLLKHGVSIVGLNVEDIVVLEGSFDPVFLICNPGGLVRMDDSEETIEFTVPFVKPQFMYSAIRCLPAKVNAFEFAFGALGHLVLWFLNSDIQSIYGCKLYWFLQKCISENTGGVKNYILI